jgi:hypothetical protein
MVPKNFGDHYYPGIYRGQVKDVEDPEKLCRLRVWIPLVHGKYSGTKEDLPWAEANLLLGGGYDKDNKVSFGIVFLPPKDAIVWVMFEGGQLDRPVWMGSPYAKSDLKQPETPDPVLVNEEFNNVKYPNIAIIKPLADKDKRNFIRFTSDPGTRDQKLELFMGVDTVVNLIKRTDQGVEKEIVEIKGKDELTIELKDGELLKIKSKNNLKLESEEGNIEIIAKGNVTIRSSENNVRLSAKQTLSGSAENVSGFSRG